MTKTILKLLSVIFVALFIWGCNEHADKHIIGVSQFIHDPWRDKFVDELRIGTYSYNNIDLNVKYADGDARRQSEQIEQMIRAGIDLLIVAPEQIGDLSCAIEKAMGKGIPVVVFGRRPGDIPCTAFVVADYYDAGYSMGEYICRMLNRKGNVVELKGVASSPSAIERHKGFNDAISKYEDIHLLASEQGDWSVKSGEKAMERMSKMLEDVDVVFGANDNVAYGAYRQVTRMGIKKHISFCGMDGLSDPNGGMTLVRDQILAASCINPTHGVEVMQLAVDILEGRKYNRENYQVSALVTKDNAAVLLMQQEELQKQIKNLDTLQEKRKSALNNINTLNFYLVIMGLLMVMLVLFVILSLVGYFNKVKLNRKLRESNVRQQQLTTEIQDLTKKQLQFFTNVSHELRTPLTLISAPVEQLYVDEQLPERYKKTIQIIRRNVNVLVQQINEILDFRRIQNNKAKLQLNRFNLADNLKEWALNFMAVADSKSIVIEFDLEDAGDGEIIADRDKIAHIFFNLMSNALKYTPSGGKILTHLEKWDDEGRDSYRLSIEDTGKGMTKETVEHIFERFYQAYGENGGTGIGLHLTKSYVDMHDGKVTVESEVGKGSNFIIILPTRHELQEESTENNKVIKYEVHAEQYIDKNVDITENMESIVSTSTSSEDKKIALVVDDNNDMRDYLKTMLADKFDVVEACDGASGLTKAKKNIPSIIISDIMMPVMDGLELCQQLKESPITSHIPVILLTAKNVDGSKAEGYQRGADSYITKPFTPEMLMMRIDNLLESRERLQKYFTDNMGETKNIVPVKEQEQPFVKQLRSIIQRRMKEPELSVEDLSEEMHLSRVQLYRKVKALTGCTPVEIIKKSRMNHAKLLLETTDKTVSEVLFEVGFTNSSYFAKCYKEEFGKTPSKER